MRARLASTFFIHETRCRTLAENAFRFGRSGSFALKFTGPLRFQLPRRVGRGFEGRVPVTTVALSAVTVIVLSSTPHMLDTPDFSAGLAVSQRDLARQAECVEYPVLIVSAGVINSAQAPETPPWHDSGGARGPAASAFSTAPLRCSR